MGNALGYKKAAKIMKINGEMIKLKTPVQAGDVLKDNPDHVLLDSEMVKHLGIRAKPLDTWHELKPKRLYFLVELPRFEQDKAPRRARSGINMSAKDRLESLMLERRSVSDLSIKKPTNVVVEEVGGREGVRLKMRLPKSEVTRVMMGSKDEAEAVEKIMGLFKADKDGCVTGGGCGARVKGVDDVLFHHQQLQWESGHRRAGKDVGFKASKKRVGFIMEGEIQLVAAS